MRRISVYHFYVLQFASDPSPNEQISIKPVQKNLINFVDIRNEGLIAALGPNQKAMDFWTDILGRYQTHLAKFNVKDEL